MTLSPTVHPLVCHPDGPDPRVRGIWVRAAREADGGLAVDYRLHGDLAALSIPAAASPLPRERLWAHTCFELFVAGEGAAAYREFNFSPSGQWMRFDFSAYRSRIPSPPGPAPRLTTARSEDQLDLGVLLAPQLLPAGDLFLGLSAVVEHADGSHRYWALRHPAGQPDFHHRDGFSLVLKAPAP
jgi:hypothetical protein